MKKIAATRATAVAVCSPLLLALMATLSACNSDDDPVVATNPTQDEGPIPLTVPKATCGTGDVPEAGLQGQVPASVRAAGFEGYNCNLTLVGQSRNDGASWQHAFFQDQAGHKCSYYDTSSSTANRTHQGVVTIDATDPTKPTPTAYLTTAGMNDPWESLKVNDKRQLLAAVNALNGNGGPEIDLYDLSGDCRQPQLLSSLPVGTGTDGSGLTIAVKGHEGSFAPDGLTYYASNLFPGYVYPVDITNTTKPKILGQFLMPGPTALTHGMAISDDGNRGYFTIFGQGAAQVTAPATATNGIVIADLSDFQSRKANPQMRVISTLIIPDGSAAQHNILIKIKGKPYIVEADEGGAGGNSAAGWAKACAAGLPAWNMARIIDIGDETKPAVISKLQLEMNDPAKCAQVTPDLAGLSGFTYGAHYCSVDNKQEATTLACGYFESGVRVFDIRNPLRPKEIAYYNPPAVTTPSPGSQNNRTAAAGRPDHCSAQLRLDAKAGTLSTTCQDNGFVSLKFRAGVWPFPSPPRRPGSRTDGSPRLSPQARMPAMRPLLPATMLAAALLAAAGPVAAQDIRIALLDCRQGVQLHARNARAVDVLKALSAALGFNISIQAPLDELVNIDSNVPLMELIPRVLPAENLIVSHRSDPRCPGHYRPARVWVLASATPPLRQRLLPMQAVPVTREAREQDELYQRAHGMMPPLEEDAAAAPAAGGAAAPAAATAAASKR